MKTEAWKILSLCVLAAWGLPVHAQLVMDSGFESGDSGTWVKNTGATFVETNAHAGTHCVKIAPHGTVLQKLEGLTPATTFVFSAYVQLDAQAKFTMMVQKFGGKDAIAKVGPPTAGAAPAYQQVKVSFTTGASDTSAVILLNNSSDGGTLFLDDVDVSLAPAETSAAPAAAATPPAPANP